MGKPRAFIFDVFGTLVDWRSSITREVAQVFSAHGIGADPHAVAVAWRDEYDPSMAPIRDGRRGYTNLDVLHRENLETVLARFDVSGLGNDVLTKLNRAWERLDPWPDVEAGLSAMRAHGLVAPCSNGSIALMAHLARHAGLNWDCILGAEVARNYKPHPDTYLKACAALQLPPDQVMMVAAHNYDLQAARAVGLRTGFIPRPLEHAEPAKQELVATSDWDVIGEDLIDLARRV